MSVVGGEKEMNLSVACRFKEEPSEEPDGKESYQTADVGVPHYLGGCGTDVDPVPGKGRAAEEGNKCKPGDERAGSFNDSGIRCHDPEHRYSGNGIYSYE